MLLHGGIASMMHRKMTESGRLPHTSESVTSLSPGASKNKIMLQIYFPLLKSQTFKRNTVWWYPFSLCHDPFGMFGFTCNSYLLLAGFISNTNDLDSIYYPTNSFLLQSSCLWFYFISVAVRISWESLQDFKNFKHSKNLEFIDIYK